MEKNYYITLINEEWRVEKSKKSINVEGGFLFCGGWNFLVSVGPTFIREMRVLASVWLWNFFDQKINIGTTQRNFDSCIL